MSNLNWSKVANDAFNEYRRWKWRSKRNSVPKYIITGHGATLNNRFTLKNGQYVVYVTECGLPGSTRLTGVNRVRQILKNPELLRMFMSNAINKSNVPSEFRPIVMTPGTNIHNQIINMSNKSNEKFNNRAGVWNLNENLYLTGHHTIKKISNVLGNLPGIYVIDACRVRLGVNVQEATNMLHRIIRGSSVPEAAFGSSRANERRIAISQAKKRPQFIQKKTTLRKNNKNEPSAKRRRLNNNMNTS